MDDDDRTQSERRWRLALSDLDSVGDADWQRRPRRQAVTRRWIVVGAVAIPLVVGAAILARGRVDTSSGASDLPTWRAILGFSMQLAGLAAEAVGLERARRGSGHEEHRNGKSRNRATGSDLRELCCVRHRRGDQ